VEILPEDRALARKSLMTWQQVNKRAVEIGVKIAIENIFEDEPTNLRVLMEE